MESYQDSQDLRGRCMKEGYFIELVVAGFALKILLLFYF